MDHNKIFQLLSQDCSFYIEKIQKCQIGHYLLRGYFYEITNIRKFKHNLSNRKPRNMPQDIHDKINEHFFKYFNWNIRNGVFTYGFDLLHNTPIDLGYGPFYLFFPIGDFDFVYSPRYFDLFGEINQLKTDLDDFIQNIEFEDKIFCNVMNTRKEYDNFANETSIRTENYYLVNINLAAELTSKIWV